jgi:hypothetical protein
MSNLPPSPSEIKPGGNGPAESFLDAALSYAARGWRVVPNHPRSKRPAGDDWQHRASCDPEVIRRRWAFTPTYNVGVQLGPQSGIIDVECDSASAEQALGELLGDNPPVVPTFQAKRGKHRLFSWQPDLPWPDKAVFKFRGIEFKTGNGGKGTQSVFPPSVHPEGAVYRWLVGPDEADPAPLPARALAALSGGEAPKVRLQGAGGGGKIREGARNETLFRRACALRGKGCSPAEIEALLQVANRERCEPPLDEAEVSRIAASAGRYKPGGKPTAAQIIRSHLQEKLQPVFRRGQHVYSLALGETVRRADVCAGADSELIRKLAAACDAPREGAKGKRSALPNLFKKWVGTAWADLWAALPEEESAGGEVAEPAAEEFRRAVAEGLYRQATFGVKVKVKVMKLVRGELKEVEEEQVRPEHRSVIDWCNRFARPGRWANLRSFLVWTRQDPAGRLNVALRVEYFSQVPGSPLARIKQKKFAALAQLYGVGTDGECRSGGARALELAPEFIQNLLDRPGMTMELTMGSSSALAREDDDLSSSREEVLCPQGT